MKHHQKHTKTDTQIVNRFPEFPSASALAGALNIPPSVVLAAKKAGLDGFLPSNRIDVGKLLASLLSRGDDTMSGADVDKSRARLNSVRADAIIRKGQLTEGQLVDVVWAGQCVDESFGDFGQFLTGRIPHLAFLLTMCARQEKVEEGVKQVTERLHEDNRGIQTMVNHGKSRMLQRFHKGPKEAGGKTILGELDKRLTEIGAQLSPSAKAEICAVLRKIHQPEQTTEPKP
jgi:hypothetical protein